jgi:hypothetical protein
MATPNKVIEIRVPGPSGPIGPQGPAGSGNAFVDALGNGNFITFITQNGNPVPILFSNFLGVAQTSSMLVPYVLNSQTSSFVLNIQTSSMTVLSSSYALTASYALNSVGGFTPSLTTDLPARNITASVISASGILSIGGIPNVSASIASLNTGTGNLQTVTSNGASTTIPITASIISASSFTGSLFGTASWATNARTASFLPVGTYNITASWAQSASNAINARTASFLPTGTYNITASWAQSASNALNSWTISDGITSESVGSSTVIGFVGGGGTTVGYDSNRNELSISTINYGAGVALDLNGSTFDVDLTELTSSTTITSSNSFIIISGSNQRLISASLIGLNIFNNNLTRFNSPITASIISASNGITGSLLGTASWATNTLTASYILNAVSSSFATTASHALNGGVTSISAGDGIAINQSTGNVIITSTGGGGSVGTLSQVTALGASTTTPITASIISASNGITGSLFGTASWADNVISASYTLTASYYQETDPIFTAKSASLATTGSNIFIGNQTITGSLIQGLEGNIATGEYSHAEGDNTQAIGLYSHAEGQQTQAYGDHSHTEGRNTIASGSYSHAEGQNTIASGSYSHAEGSSVKAIGEWSHAEGDFTQAKGDYSHAEGNRTIASGSHSHAEGYLTIASGDYSHTEGNNTKAIGTYSHAKGQSTQATGNFSHAEGDSTIAQGNGSHAEGVATLTLGLNSHAEGLLTTASANYSHAEGQQTQAIGEASHAEGLGTIAFGSYQHVQGQWNATSSVQSAFIVGNGTNGNNRSNLIHAAGNEVQISGSMIFSTGGITGSLLGTASLANRNILTASVSLNTLLFTKGDGTQFSLTVNTRSGGGITLGGDNNSGNLITATGTNEIYGEVNLTFKSPVLAVNNGIVATKFVRFSSSLAKGSSDGLIINYGSTSTVEGYLYYLSSSNIWVTSSLTLTSGSLLAIATSTNSSGGMLLQGISAHPDLDNLTPGATIYLSGSGRVSQTAPTTSNQQVRVIGYGLSGSTFVFNPSTEYVTLA